ncbi:MAG: hypothetical protein Q7U97_15540 [Rhodocyclaceae bacterium]|nr:hypothetical protein [Rhodocyclaceae bacterium]
MPLSSLIPAIVSSIIESIVDAPAPAPAQPSGPVIGQIRTLPAGSKVGLMAPPALGAVQIDDQVLPLSPAAQIRNELNMIVVPTAIRQPVPVRYMTDASGAVWRVWVMTPAELAASSR